MVQQSGEYGSITTRNAFTACMDMHSHWLEACTKAVKSMSDGNWPGLYRRPLQISQELSGDMLQTQTKYICNTAEAVNGGLVSPAQISNLCHQYERIAAQYWEEQLRVCETMLGLMQHTPASLIEQINELSAEFINTWREAADRMTATGMEEETPETHTDAPEEKDPKGTTANKNLRKISGKAA